MRTRHTAPTSRLRYALFLEREGDLPTAACLAIEALELGPRSAPFVRAFRRITGNWWDSLGLERQRVLVAAEFSPYEPDNVVASRLLSGWTEATRIVEDPAADSSPPMWSAGTSPTFALTTEVAAMFMRLDRHPHPEARIRLQTVAMISILVDRANGRPRSADLPRALPWIRTMALALVLPMIPAYAPPRSSTSRAPSSSPWGLRVLLILTAAFYLQL